MEFVDVTPTTIAAMSYSWTSINSEFKYMFSNVRLIILGQNKARHNIFYNTVKILTKFITF